MSAEEIPACLAAHGLVALSIVVRPDGTGEVQYARAAPRHLQGEILKTRYYCDLDLQPTRRTAEAPRRALANARDTLRT